MAKVFLRVFFSPNPTGKGSYHLFEFETREACIVKLDFFLKLKVDIIVEIHTFSPMEVKGEYFAYTETYRYGQATDWTLANVQNMSIAETRAAYGLSMGAVSNLFYPMGKKNSARHV